MKRCVFFVLLMLVFFMQSHICSAESNSIIGRATSSPFDLFVNVTALTPTITIISPENTTYISESLLLNYTASNYFKLWYNLDNLNNYSLETPTIINITAGSHTLFIYANNSDGTTVVANVTFTADLTSLVIWYKAFENSSYTTPLKYYSLEELQNVVNLTLDNDYGRIKFVGIINITDIPNNGTVIDIDQYVQVNNLQIAVDISGAPVFNKSAILTMRGVSLKTPEILLDGTVCSASICIVSSYSSGVLVFSATQLGTFTLREKPVTPPGQGGGGGGAQNREILTLNKDALLINIKQGETKEDKIEITNPTTNTIYINAILNELSDMIIISNKTITLLPGQTITLPVKIMIKEDSAPMIYSNIVYLRGTTGVLGHFNVILDVSSKNALFNVFVTIPEQFKTVAPGSDFAAKVDLFNLGDKETVNINLTYNVLDMGNNILLSSTDTTTVYKNKTITKEITLLKNLKDGQYVFQVRGEYESKLVSASALFFVKSTKNQIFPLFATIITIIGTLLIVYIILRRNVLPQNALKNYALSIKEKVSELTKSRKIRFEKPRVWGLSEHTVENTVNKLANRLRQIEYSHNTGFLENEKYHRVKTSLIKKIQWLHQS
jgi:hypothetical protein